MPHSSNGHRKILVHLTKKHREEIQRNILSKRAVFIKMLREGIVAMLNTQDEQRALKEDKDKLSTLISKRSEERKANIDSVVDTVKSTTRGAPMGAEVGANTAVTMLGAAAKVYENTRESIRVLEEAQEDYRSAQILHYIPVSKQDYKLIGERVATVLADRLACALFRLAAGENGVLVLGQFLLTSMNVYAIKRLRQHESTREEIIRALIDAATPPPSDRFHYVGWPTIRYSNRSLHFLLHKTLEQDPYADEIIAFSGPGVSVIFGGHRSYFDFQTGKKIIYQDYTIQGILCHAPILDNRNIVVRGLETGNRKNETLDGSTKYPMIILCPGETIADLGVNFVPNDNSELLEPEHEEVIFRVFPNRPASPSVFCADLERANKDFCYINEKYEVPWGRNRAIRMQERSAVIYNAGRKVSETETIVTRANYHRQRAQQIAIHQFDAAEALEDAKVVTSAALDARTELCATDITALDRHKKYLRVIMASKYATSAATALIDCCVEGHLLVEAYLTAAINAVEAARAALNAIRRSPVDETNDYQKILIASQKVAQISDEVFDILITVQEGFQMLLDVVEQSPAFVLGRKFADIETTILATSIKKMTRLARQQLKECKELSDFAGTMVSYRPKSEGEIGFSQIADEIRTDLNTASLTEDTELIIKTIELCELVTKRNLDAMRLILETDEFTLMPIDENDLDHPHELGAEAIQNVFVDAHAQAMQSLTAANTYWAGLSRWRKKTTSYGSINQPLQVHLEAAVAAKKRSKELFERVEYKKNTKLGANFDQMVKDFFIYAKAASEQGRLHFSVRHKESKSSGMAISSRLTEKLSVLDNLAALLSLAAKERNAPLAEQAYQSAVIAEKDLSVNMPLREFLQKIRNIKQAKIAVERAVTDDIEIIDFELNQAQLALVEMEKSLQVSNDNGDKLLVLQRSCFSRSVTTSPRSNSTASLAILEESDNPKERSPSPISPILERLSLAFQKELEQIVFEGLPAYEVMIGTKLLQIYQHYLQLDNGMSSSEFRSRVLEKLRSMQGLEMPNDNWGIWLVSDMVLWAIERTQATQMIKDKINEAKQELDVIIQISDNESPDLKIARKDAMLSLKKAYAHLSRARKEQAYAARALDNQRPLPLNLVRTTLRWAGRFNSEELAWWHKEHSGRSSVSLVDVKFPSRLVYAFFRTYSKQKLIEVKEQVGELNIVKRKLKEYSKHLHILENSSGLLGWSQLIDQEGLVKLKKSHGILSEIIDNTLRQLLVIKDSTSVLRDTIRKREVAPYFNQWRENTLGAKPKGLELTEVEADDRPDLHDFEQICSMLECFETELRSMCPNIFSATNYFLLPTNQEFSPYTRSMAMRNMSRSSLQGGMFSPLGRRKSESSNGSQDHLETDLKIKEGVASQEFRVDT